MSLVRARDNREQGSAEQDERALMCTFPGCHFRWSVKIDRPMCSFHQWGKGPYSERTETPAQKEIKAGLKANRPRYGEPL